MATVVWPDAAASRCTYVERMTGEPIQPVRHRVLIAGGGIAGLEAMIALRSLAAERVDVLLLAPTEEFVVRALSVEAPFARPSPRRYALEDACRDHGAEFARDAIAAVRPETRRVVTEGGEELGFDSLLVAVGATPVPAFERARTFRGMQDAETLHGLVQDLEGGYVRSVCFVVPPGTTWPLPLYELALMAAERADSMGMDVALSIVTPESAPLAIFGRSASDAVERELARRGIALTLDAYVSEVRSGCVLAKPGSVEIRAQSVVALPLLNGPRVDGLPVDNEGFIRVDEHGHVRGIDGIYAAGDGTTLSIKQGGLAAQQAGAAARSIARRAGADVPELPFRPQLRAKLLTGSRATYLRQALAGGAGDDASEASSEPLWWPPAKVAAPFLAPYLERVGREASRS